jgi:hypothetical protein
MITSCKNASSSWLTIRVAREEVYTQFNLTIYRFLLKFFRVTHVHPFFTSIMSLCLNSCRFFSTYHLRHLVYIKDGGPKSAPYRAELLDLRVCPEPLFYIILIAGLPAGSLNAFDDDLDAAVVGAPLE